MRNRKQEKKHYHLYKKCFFPSGKVYWKCIDHCNHYVHNLDVINRDAMCPYCKNPFVVTQRQLDKGQITLHCNNCYSPKGFGRKKYLEQVKLRARQDGVTELELDKLVADVFSGIRANQKLKEEVNEVVQEDKEIQEIIKEDYNKVELPHELDEGFNENTGTE